MQRLGRKTLLSLSAIGAFLSLVGVGYGLDSGAVALASVTILTFVAYVLLLRVILPLLNAHGALQVLRDWYRPGTLRNDS